MIDNNKLGMAPIWGWARLGGTHVLVELCILCVVYFWHLNWFWPDISGAFSGSIALHLVTWQGIDSNWINPLTGLNKPQGWGYVWNGILSGNQTLLEFTPFIETSIYSGQRISQLATLITGKCLSQTNALSQFRSLKLSLWGYPPIGSTDDFRIKDSNECFVAISFTKIIPLRVSSHWKHRWFSNQGLHSIPSYRWRFHFSPWKSNCHWFLAPCSHCSYFCMNLPSEKIKHGNGKFSMEVVQMLCLITGGYIQ